MPNADDAARRAYWTAQMDEAYAFMQRMRDWPIDECGEPLVALPDAAAADGVKVVFSARPASNGAPRLYLLRAGLLAPFLAVARAMNARGWVLKVEDAYRTVDMQRDNVRLPGLFAAVLRKTGWECGGRTPPLELVTRRLAALIAATPRAGTHLAGSALDVSVLDRATGHEIDRGFPYLEMSEATPMASPFVSPAGQRHRREITALFARHGFEAYPWEFWHYNAGDVYAACLRRTGLPARYGPVHCDPATGAVTPVADPNAPLNPPATLADLLRQALDASG